jgi:hypothetical protein
MHISREQIKNTMVFGATLAGAFLARKIMEKTKVALTKKEPPKNPVDQDISWKDAIIWMVSTGAILGLVKLIVRRNVTIGAEKLLNNG